jgi:predicted dehydrogenase
MGRMSRLAAMAALVAVAAIMIAAAPQTKEREAGTLRIGLIGLDTSHAVAFTEMLNDASRRDHVPGGRVVAAYKGGSPGLAISDTRIERFTADVTSKWGVTLVDSIDTLLTRVDVVMLLSVDARQHLAQVRPVLAAHKRVFIDKPIAASYRDTRAIADLARDAKTPFFSSSSLRYAPHIQHLREQAGASPALGALTWGPMPTESYLPDLFWYGIHSVESLYALMGPGCESVSRISTAGADVVSCRWRDGRIGTMRGNRDDDHAYGALLFNRDATLSETAAQAEYHGLVVEIMKFFTSGVPPVSPEETLELVAFMEAADVSKTRGGAPVPITEITGAR